MDPPAYPLDAIESTVCCEKNFLVNKESFSTDPTLDTKELNVYTDGSGVEGSFGSGMVIFGPEGPISSQSKYLGKLATVFLAEIAAISTAAETLLDMDLDSRSVGIYVDSQAALQALDSNTFKSSTVLSCANLLNKLGRRTSVELFKVKAHAGVNGNERADNLAKIGASNLDGEHGPEPFIPVPNAVFNNFFKDRVTEMWSKQWLERIDCRQTKMFFPTPNKSVSARLVGQDRKTYSEVVQLITGHNYLNRHKNVIDRQDIPECRLCLEDEESSWHVVAECPALAEPRRQVFGTCVLPTPLEWHPTQLLRYLREPSMRELFGGPEAD